MTIEEKVLVKANEVSKVVESIFRGFNDIKISEKRLDISTSQHDEMIFDFTFESGDILYKPTVSVNLEEDSFDKYVEEMSKIEIKCEEIF